MKYIMVPNPISCWNILMVENVMEEYLSLVA